MKSHLYYGIVGKKDRDVSPKKKTEKTVEKPKKPKRTFNPHLSYMSSLSKTKSKSPSPTRFGRKKFGLGGDLARRSVLGGTFGSKNQLNGSSF